MDNYSLIADLFLFNGIDFNDIETKYNVLSNLIIKPYNSGEIILSSNDKPIGIGIISAGKALITTSSQNNSPTLRKLSTGDTFGAASLFSKSRDYSTSVIADGPCTVIYITKDNVRNLCDNEPTLSMNYINFLSDRISFLNSKVSTFSAQSSDAKLAYYIYSAANGQEKEFLLPVTYSQLADNLALGRASLYRSLDLLIEEKIIERNNRTIKILSIEKLKKFFN